MLFYNRYMPNKNTLRESDIDAYYHVYNRGAGKQPIFHDDQDRLKFLSLFARHLDPTDTSVRGDGLPYPSYDVELVAYCLMDNHFHLLLYQGEDTEGLSGLMKSVGIAYTMYFNKKYRASGHLFEGQYKSSRIDSDQYLLHITRYIHMNPRYYLRYRWSSIGAYLGKESPPWLNSNRINTMSPSQYRAFLKSYEEQKAELDLLKEQLVVVD